MSSDWQKHKLGDIIEFNPRETIKKNTIARKIPMEALTPFQREVENWTYEEFKGGVKFRNHDTLMARITPSLENGKTSIVTILDEDEVAFGSTEFFVLRAKKEIDSKYLYYLTISQDVRERAIQSMTGTSGRQRAQKEAILEYELYLPSLKEQKKIVNVLDTLDSKIELNNEMITTMEETAATLFQHWFVDFEFPDENGNPYKSSGGKMIESELGEIPEGFTVCNLEDIVKVVMGQSPKSDTYNNNGEGLPLINGASDFKGGTITPLKYTTDPKKLAQKGDYVFGVRATVGNVTYVDKEYAIGRGVGIVRCENEVLKEFIYFILVNGINYLESTATGSVYVNISKNDFEKMKVVLPTRDVLTNYHNTASHMLTQKNNLYGENQSLIQLRDTLLPKLLSGEIELPMEEEVRV